MSCIESLTEHDSCDDNFLDVFLVTGQMQCRNFIHLNPAMNIWRVTDRIRPRCATGSRCTEAGKGWSPSFWSSWGCGGCNEISTRQWITHVGCNETTCWWQIGWCKLLTWISHCTTEGSTPAFRVNTCIWTEKKYAPRLWCRGIWAHLVSK